MAMDIFGGVVKGRGAGNRFSLGLVRYMFVVQLFQCLVTFLQATVLHKMHFLSPCQFTHYLHIKDKARGCITHVLKLSKLVERNQGTFFQNLHGITKKKLWCKELFKMPMKIIFIIHYFIPVIEILIIKLLYEEAIKRAENLFLKKVL